MPESRFRTQQTNTAHCPLCAALSEPAAQPPRPAGSAGRRRFLGALAAASAGVAFPAPAQEGVDVGGQSVFSRLVPPEQIEAAATQQYAQMLGQARAQKALAPDSHPQVQRLRYIAQRLIPLSAKWNERAKLWKWEVNLIGSKQINAFCMPGGKIAFFTGILERLKLNDDEVAQIMGHEMAHALREHARERLGKTAATRLGAGLLSSILGLGNTGDALLSIGGQLLTLKFSREDESESDIVGLDLAARAGYAPEAAVRLWQKMIAESQGAPPQFLSTHPAGEMRIRDIQRVLPRVMPLYKNAPKPDKRFDG